MLWVVALMMPVYSAAHCCYFTLRSGGRTIITFIFDSGFTWCVCVPVTFALAYLTAMPIVPLYLFCQLADIGKCVIGLILIRKGVWIRNIVQKEGAYEKHTVLPQA